MTYLPIKFGCKKINSSVDMVEIVIFDSRNLNSDFELEDSKPIFLQDIGLYKVIKGSAVKEISSR